MAFFVLVSGGCPLDDWIGLMKRTLSAVAAAVLVSVMVLMFLAGLLKKAARVVDGFHDGSG